MKNLSIEVSSIANLVKNGDFELWENDIPTYWTATNGDGVVGFANTLWGLGVQLSVPESSVTTQPKIVHSADCSDLSTNDHLTLGFWYKGDFSVNINQSDDTLIKNLFSNDTSDSEWKFKTYNFTYDTSFGNIKIELTKYTSDNSGGDHTTCLYDNAYFYDNTWYANRKHLDTTQVKHFDDFTRAIEDDLFTFKSDNMSFTVRHYGSNGDYFNTEDFITYSDRIFRFDINMKYIDIDGDDIDKKMVMFSNNDTIKRIHTPITDDLTIELFELSTLFKDNGWFLGTPTTENEGEPEEKTYFKYNTYVSGGSPDIIGFNVSTADVLTNLTEDIRTLITRHFIPVPINDFDIGNEIVNSDFTIGINYDWKIDNVSGKYIVIDIVNSPATGRVFLMLLSYDRLDNYIDDNEITIWEFVNGSTLKQTETPHVTWIDNAVGRLGKEFAVAFIHKFDRDYYGANDSNILFGFVQNSRAYNIYFFNCKLFTDNSGTSLESTQGTGYDIDTEDDIKLYWHLEWTVGEPVNLQINKCRYINSAGYTERPPYSATLDNMLFLEQYRTATGTEGTYTASGISSLENLYITTSMKYATTLNALIYRFSQGYSFIFEDVYPSDVFRELCISQDAMWYMDYSQTTNDITATIKTRPTTVTSTILTDANVLREDSMVRKIKFRDLDGNLFREDKTRMMYWYSYYNSTYGGGRYEKNSELYGYHDYSLGDDLKREDNQYFIKGFTLNTNDRRTFIILFQKGA